jgi:hypothetical protein
MASNKRRGPPGGGHPSSENVALENDDSSDTNLEIPVSQLRPRPIGPGELAELRAMFWRQARLGHRLPAEAGIIAIDGGRS